MSEREELTAAVASLEGLSAFIGRRAWEGEWIAMWFTHREDGAPSRRRY